MKTFKLFDKWKRQYYLWIPTYLLTPRYQEKLIRLPDGKRIRIADFASFFSTYKSIFVDRIYDFHSPTPKPKIVICGENIGLSVLFFKQLYPASRVIAFEADPYIYSLLQKNVSSWKLKNVALFNKAVWTKATTLEFYSDNADGGRIEGTTLKRKVVPVEAINFREFLKKEKNITFLNMDIEGAENEILPKIADELSVIPFVFIELHSIAHQPIRIGEALTAFQTHGFQIHMRPEFYSPSPFLHRTIRDNMDMQVNIFAWKE